MSKKNKDKTRKNNSEKQNISDKQTSNSGKNDKNIYYLEKNICLIFLYAISIFCILVLGIFEIFNKIQLVIVILIISIIIYFLGKKYYYCIELDNKLKIIKEIIDSENLKNLSSTTSYNKNVIIEKTTSSDQQAKVLIAAIEAIKEL